MADDLGYETIGANGGTSYKTPHLDELADAGIHVPLMANWPGQVANGKVCSDLVDSTDFLPTLLEAARVPLPSGLKCDGRSFLPRPVHECSSQGTLILADQH